MLEEIDGLELREELGRGGFSHVWRAWQPALHRDVAVKLLTADAGDPVVMARFERECQTLGSLSTHPNVVAVHGSGVTASGRPYLVLELCPGGTLADRGQLGWRSASEITVKIAGALSAAHRRGVIHRDIKPHNVLFTELDEPKLADFGIASMIQGFETQSSSVSLSLAYAAPEVLDGRAAGPRSDLYALAATAMSAILGHAPFHRDNDSVAALAARVATAPIPDLRAHGVPSGVCDVLERAMAKVPDDRQPDVDSFVRELTEASGIDDVSPVVEPSRSAIASSQVDDDDEDAAATARPPLRRSAPRRRAILIAAAIVTVLGAVALSTFTGGDSGVALRTSDTHADRPTPPEATEPSIPDTEVLSETTAATDPAVADEGPSNDDGLSVSTGPTVSSGPAVTSERQPTTRRLSPGSSPASPPAITPSGVGASGPTTPPSTAVPPQPTTAPTPTSRVNQAPVLPPASFEFHVPINTKSVLIPAGDTRLAAGWNDPDNTASWLCLVFSSDTQDFWMDGMDCTGSGLWVNATTPGLRRITVRASECSPTCGAPYSTGSRTINVYFETR